MGVNLPAQLVVIKSTLQYHGAASGYKEYTATSVLQMVGRAGRPGFDVDASTGGTAVVMTRKTTAQVYERLCGAESVNDSISTAVQVPRSRCGLAVESCLHFEHRLQQCPAAACLMLPRR